MVWTPEVRGVGHCTSVFKMPMVVRANDQSAGVNCVGSIMDRGLEGRLSLPPQIPQVNGRVAPAAVGEPDDVAPGEVTAGASLRGTDTNGAGALCTFG